MVTTILTKEQAEQDPKYTDGLKSIRHNATNENRHFFIAHGRIGSLIFNLLNYQNWCEKHGQNGKDGKELVIII